MTPCASLGSSCRGEGVKKGKERDCVISCLTLSEPNGAVNKLNALSSAVASCLCVKEFISSIIF